MQRGVITLSRDEVKEAIELTALQNLSTPMISKLVSAKDIDIQSPSLQVQVSEDELEIILDSIGVPEMGESPIKSSLREKIRASLGEIRGAE